MKIKILNIYILILILNNFISFIKCQCNKSFYQTNYGCNNNIGFKGFYATNCIGAEGGYVGTSFIRIVEGGQPSCPTAGNYTNAYLPYGYSSSNEIINNQITFTLCYSNEKNLNLYYIGSQCLSSNEKLISNITVNLNGYIYVGSCSNNYSVFKSYSNSSDFNKLRNSECSNTFGSYEIAYNSVYYGDIQCPNCNSHGTCNSNETNYKCQCSKEYSYDEYCRYNYCDQPIYPCNQAKCNSSSIECYCDSGYKLNSTTNQCLDINECIISSSSDKYPCLTNYICLNKEGSFECQCPYNSTLNNSNKVCQLKCLNNCGGSNQGTCINGNCVCKSGYTGIDCLDINLISNDNSNDTKPYINSTSPSVIFKSENQSYKSIVFIKEIIEIDIYSNIINQYNLSLAKWDYKNITSLSLSTEEVENYLYNTTINNNGHETNIKVLLKWFKNQESGKILEFANQELIINPYSLKFNIELSSYSFKNQLSTLQLIIGASMTSNKASCSSYSIDQTNYDSDYFTLNVDDKSFQCRLLKRGIIDNEIKVLSNSFKYFSNENNSTTTSLSLITNIPYYLDSAILDPDMGIILKGSTQDTQEFGKICKNNGLSDNQLIGVIVGSCVGFILLIVISIIIFKKSHFLRSTKVTIKLRQIF